MPIMPIFGSGFSVIPNKTRVKFGNVNPVTVDGMSETERLTPEKTLDIIEKTQEKVNLATQEFETRDLKILAGDQTTYGLNPDNTLQASKRDSFRIRQYLLALTKEGTDPIYYHLRTRLTQVDPKQNQLDVPVDEFQLHKVGGRKPSFPINFDQMMTDLNIKPEEAVSLYYRCQPKNKQTLVTINTLSNVVAEYHGQDPDFKGLTESMEALRQLVMDQIKNSSIA